MDRRAAVVAVVVAAATFALYSPVRDHEFLLLDDGRYVVRNPLVRDGFSVSAAVRAFTTPYLGNWIPLSYVSLQIDRSLYGDDPAGTLLTNAGLHALASGALVLALHALSGSLWPSAFVGAVFAFHPLHVESVAWASERKDVLSALLFMLTLLAYAAYARRPGPARYALVAACFALGLLAKSMLVTLPALLLLLDLWPLRRLPLAEGRRWPEPAALGRLALEKLPLMGFVLVSGLVTLWSQTEDRAVFPSDVLPLGLRVLNAFASYAAYLRDAVWPASLGPFYPHPLDDVSRSAALVGALLVFGVAGLGLRWIRERPWILVGWLWYVGMLVPVIGLLQVGMQARADRYTYLPLVGVAIAVAWSARELSRRLPPAVPACLGLAACAAMAWGTHLQLPHWRDSEAIFRRALAVTRDNFVAEQGLGFALMERRRPREAVTHFANAVALRPGFARPRVGLGNALVESGEAERAIPHYLAALETTPDDPALLGNLGIALVLVERFAEAAPHLERALALHAAEGTDSARTRRARGDVRAAQERHAEALALYEDALRAFPRDVDLLARAGIQAEQAGRPERARAHYAQAVSLEPRFVGVANNLAWLLATCEEEAVRDAAEALRVIERALAEAGPEAVALLDTRAAALAAAGRLEEATTLARRAAGRAAETGQDGLAETIRRHADTFARGRPLIRSCRGEDEGRP